MQVVDPIGSAPNFAADVARAKALEPLVRESGSADLTEFAERFVISHPAVSTMLVGYSTLGPPRGGHRRGQQGSADGGDP